MEKNKSEESKVKQVELSDTQFKIVSDALQQQALLEGQAKLVQEKLDSIVILIGEANGIKDVSKPSLNGKILSFN